MIETMILIIILATCGLAYTCGMLSLYVEARRGCKTAERRAQLSQEACDGWLMKANVITELRAELIVNVNTAQMLHSMATDAIAQGVYAESIGDVLGAEQYRTEAKSLQQMMEALPKAPSPKVLRELLA